MTSAASHVEALESAMRAEIDALVQAINNLESSEAQRGAARRLRKRFHPDASRDVISLLPARAAMYQSLSQHANSRTERFLDGPSGGE